MTDTDIFKYFYVSREKFTVLITLKKLKLGRNNKIKLIKLINQ